MTQKVFRAQTSQRLFPWQRSRRTLPRFCNNMGRKRFHSLVRKTPFMTGTWFLTELSIPRAPAPGNALKHSPHAVRDILAQRWVQTKTAYEHQNPKRIYYLSMEFLLGRSLTNNIANLLLDPMAREIVKEKDIDWLELIEQEPMRAGKRRSGPSSRMLPGLYGNDAVARRGLRSALRVRYVSTVVCGMAGSRRIPTTGCATVIPGRFAANTRRWTSS